MGSVGSRLQRLVFGEDATLYDRIRPSYPRAVIDRVLEGLPPNTPVLDVGSGTGRAAVLVAERGHGGVALEADPRMAEVAERNLEPFPSWRVDIGEFEQAAYCDFGLLTCAQAWHWLDPAARLARAHDSLQPGGRLALWWNRPAKDDSALRQAIDAVYDKLAPEMATHGVGEPGNPRLARRQRLDERVEPWFVPEEEVGVPWDRTYTRHQWTSLLETQSDHRLLPAARRRALLDAVGAAIEEHGGRYEHRYVCWLWTARRR
jgi:SAM-dependent methyltransferase